MEEFKIESKGSIIGLIIKIVIFTILANRVFSIIERFLGESNIIRWILTLGIISYLIYNYFTDLTTLTIKDNKVVTESKIGFPKKLETNCVELNNIKKINLIQSHNQVYGKKTIECIDQNSNKQTFELKLRYYQLVKLQEYLNDKLHIETKLIG